MGTSIHFEIPGPQDGCPKIQSLKSQRDRVVRDHNDRLFVGRGRLLNEYRQIVREIDETRRDCAADCSGPVEILGGLGLSKLCGMELAAEAENAVREILQTNQGEEIDGR